MSQRSRIVGGAIFVLVSLVLTVPAPVSAAPISHGKLPQAGGWELAWSWFSNLVSGGQGGAPVLASRWEKEGGVIDPNGYKAPNAISLPPSPSVRPDGGSR